MYRLPIGSYPTIRKVISKELAGVLCGMFTIWKTADGDYEINEDGEIDLLLQDLLRDDDETLTFVEVPDDMHAKVEKKIIKMVKELLDEENEYTFDTFGEYIIYQELCVFRDIENDFSDDQDDWTTKATAEDIPELFKEVSEIVMERNSECDNSYEALPKALSDISNTVGNILYARLYFDTILDEYIMWDMDYLLYEDFNYDMAEEFFNSENGTCIDGQEPESGSTKYPISKSLRGKLHTS